MYILFHSILKPKKTDILTISALTKFRIFRNVLHLKYLFKIFTKVKIQSFLKCKNGFWNQPKLISRKIIVQNFHTLKSLTINQKYRLWVCSNVQREKTGRYYPTSVHAVPILQTKTSLCQKPLRFFIDLCIYLFLQPFKNRAARRFQTSFKLQICKSFS